MKKFLSLLLCLALCLTMAGCGATPETPAATEAPAATEMPASVPQMEMPTATLNLPISFNDYKARYEAGLNAFVPGTTITWQDTSDETNRSMTAVVGGAFVGSICTLDDADNIIQLMLIYQGTLETSDVMNFLTLCSYSGIPLLTTEEVTPQDAMSTFMNGVFAVFNNMLGGYEPEGLFGHPVAMQISPMDDGTHTFFFAVDLSRTTE